MDSILLVDDDQTFLATVHLALETAGYDVMATADSEAAFAWAEENPCAVAIVALELADGSGPWLVKQLSTSSQDTECLLMTANPDISALVDLYELGNVYGHRWKPLQDFSDLARDIARAMERRSLRRQNAHLLTELRDVRDEIRSQAEFLVQVEKMAALGQIAGDLAEELEAPLGSLTDYGEYVRRAASARSKAAEDRSSTITSMVTQMSLAAQQCRKLVQSLAAYAEGDARPVERVDLRELVDDTFEILLHSLNKRKVELDLDLDQNALPIAANRALLQQAVTHLALNALHAMPDGGKLSVKLESFEGDPPGMRLTMADTGCGIDAETLPHIFQPFFTTRPFGTGTGLGLTIVRSITQDFDGDIAVESEPGTGTTFTLTFPAAAVMAPPMLSRSNAA